MRGRAFLALTLLAGGCAGSTGTQPDAAAPPDVQPRWESCAAALPAPSPGPVLGDGGAPGPLPHLDSSFTPVFAVLCRTAPLMRPGGGEDLEAVEERADDITALVAALRLPDEPPTNGACTAEGWIQPYLVLLDADGRWIRPGVPVDGCHKPRLEFRDAFGGLKTTKVSGRTVGQVKSDEAATAGCEQQWADMVWATGQMGGGKGSTPVLADSGAAVQICRFRVPAGEQGSGKPGGDFESGGKFASWPAVRQELSTAATATGACTTPSARFALLRTPSGDVYVEADGCKRVLIDNGTAMRTASPKLLSLIF
ncbi:hypothetical protein [Actinoplanes sp. NPDC026619]|uniref:hypothetical protein n=1 Tax=Actinoplanes sp. NPDC026619 TaxID=3155798 RepID=UPI0034042FFF